MPPDLLEAIAPAPTRSDPARRREPDDAATRFQGFLQAFLRTAADAPTETPKATPLPARAAERIRTLFDDGSLTRRDIVRANARERREFEAWADSAPAAFFPSPVVLPNAGPSGAFSETAASQAVPGEAPEAPAFPETKELRPDKPAGNSETEAPMIEAEDATDTSAAVEQTEAASAPAEPRLLSWFGLDQLPAETAQALSEALASELAQGTGAPADAASLADLLPGIEPDILLDALRRAAAAIEPPLELPAGRLEAMPALLLKALGGRILEAGKENGGEESSLLAELARGASSRRIGSDGETPAPLIEAPAQPSAAPEAHAEAILPAPPAESSALPIPEADSAGMTPSSEKEPETLAIDPLAIEPTTEPDGAQNSETFPQQGDSRQTAAENAQLRQMRETGTEEGEGPRDIAPAPAAQSLPLPAEAPGFAAAPAIPGGSELPEPPSAGATEAASPTASAGPVHAAKAEPAPPARPEGLPAMFRAENLERVEQAMRFAARQGVSHVSVELLPQEIGRLTLRLEMKHGAVSAVIQADSADAKQFLLSGLDQLRQNLQVHGIDLESFDVQLNQQGAESGGGDTRRERRRSPAPASEATVPVSLPEPSSPPATGALNVVV